MKRIITVSLIPVALAAGIAGAAWAGTDKAEMSDAEEVRAALDSGMTLTQAVDAALSRTGGTALSAGWEDNDQGAWGYEVEIADTTGAVQTWFVNPADGSVSKVMEAQDDHRDGEHADVDDDDHDGD